MLQHSFFNGFLFPGPTTTFSQDQLASCIVYCGERASGRACQWQDASTRRAWLQWQLKEACSSSVRRLPCRTRCPWVLSPVQRPGSHRWQLHEAFVFELLVSPGTLTVGHDSQYTPSHTLANVTRNILHSLRASSIKTATSRDGATVTTSRTPSGTLSTTTTDPYCHSGQQVSRNVTIAGIGRNDGQRPFLRRAAREDRSKVAVLCPEGTLAANHLNHFCNRCRDFLIGAFERQVKDAAPGQDR